MLIKGSKFIEEWAAAHTLRRPLKIMQTDRITAPLSVGIARPRIILPKAMDLENQKLVHYVLTHEYFHIRRFDMFWKLLALCAACIHWFNPMAWIMLLLLNRDLEITCDEMVCRHFGGNMDEKKSYACSLISMAELRGGYIPIYSYFSKNALEERITAIMKSKKMTSGGIIVAAIITVFAATVFTLSPADAGETQEEPQIDMVVESSCGRQTAPELPGGGGDGKMDGEQEGRYYFQGVSPGVQAALRLDSRGADHGGGVLPVERAGAAPGSGLREGRDQL